MGWNEATTATTSRFVQSQKTSPKDQRNLVPKSIKADMFNGKFEGVCVGFVAPNTFRCRIKSHQEEYNNLMLQINLKFCSSENIRPQTEIKVGQMCLVRVPRLNAVYRAQIVMLAGTHSVHALLIDEGCVEVVERRFVYKMLEDWEHLPPLALELTLSDVPSHLGAYYAKHLTRFLEELTDSQSLIEIDPLKVNDSQCVVKITGNARVIGENGYYELKEKFLRDFKRQSESPPK